MLSPDGAYWWDGRAWRSTLSPDGAYWWDGRAWRSTLSPDGRHRRVGNAWVAVRGATALQPTAWTAPMQRAAAALVALQSVWGLVAVMLLFGGVASLTSSSLLPPGTADAMTPAEQESMLQTLRVTVIASGAAGLIVELGVGVVLLVGCLKRWRWVFWFLLVVGLLAAFGLLEIPALIVATAALGPGPYDALLLPTWAYAASFVLDGLALALAVWMLVAVRRFGTWACVRVPRG